MEESLLQSDSEVHSSEKPIRLRISVSSSFSYLSQVRVALFAYFLSVQKNGKLIVRLDDLKENEKDGSLVESIIESFKWLKIGWAEGLGLGANSCFQSERKAVYQDYLQKLLDQKKAYFCFCTPEKLDEDRRRFLGQGRTPRYSGACRNLSEAEIAAHRESGSISTIRLKTDRQVVKFSDLLQGAKSVDSEEIGDQVLQSANGQFTFDFASVVDDLLMNITDVFRGENELLNTPNQILIFNAFNAPIPRFVHIPMVLGPDHLLISEKHGSATLPELRKEGYLPDALVNYLGLLGWNHVPRREIVSTDEIVKKFEIKNIVRTSPVLDWDKLKKINAYYLKALTFSDFFELSQKLIPNYKDFLNKKGDESVQSTLKLLQSECKTIGEVGEILQLLVYPIRTFSDDVKRFFFKDSAKILKLAKSELANLNEFNLEGINSYLKTLKEKAKSKAINFYVPLRVALTGKSQGADLSLLISLLGKEETNDRIDYATKNLQHTPAA